MNRTTQLFLLPLALTTACGARTVLEDAGALDRPATTTSSSSSTSVTTTSSGGGEGGATTSSSSSTGIGGEGGAGGGPIVTCQSPTFAPEVITLGDAEANITAPNLVLFGDTGAGVVHFHQSLVKATPATLRAAAFEAWDTWPPAIDLSSDLKEYQTFKTLTPGAFLAGERLQTIERSFSLLYTGLGNFKLFAAPAATLLGIAGYSFEANPGKRLFAMAPSPAKSGHLALAELPQGNRFGLTANVSTTSHANNYESVGCATTPIAADAVGVGEYDWLFAAALGTPIEWELGLGPCSKPMESVGPATRLSFARLDKSSYPATLGATILTTTPITRVRMAHHPGGAWVVWSEAPSDAPTSITAVRIDGAGLVVSPQLPIAIVAGAPGAASFDADHLGDDLVVGTIEASGAAAVIQIQSLGPDGAPKWSASITPEGAIEGPLDLAASPAGDALLVAWTEKPNGSSARRARVARLSCDGAP